MTKRKKKQPSEGRSYKHDYPIEEVWNTDNTLAQLIVPRIQAFKALDKHGGPSDFMDMREWNNAIQKMIDAFELMKYAGATHTEDEEQIIEQGLDLFRKYFRSLWDLDMAFDYKNRLYRITNSRLIHMKEQNCIEAEKLKPVFDLIDEKVTFHAEREKVKRNIMDVLNAPKSLVSIDINDVRDLFQEGGKIHAFDISVDASKENRMALLMAQIMRNAKYIEPYIHALVFFFFPEGRPLLMEELKPFSDWIESVPGEFMVKWGMATQFTQDLRAIVILQ